MDKKNKIPFFNPWLKQFLTSVLATSIGLGLTFTVNKTVDNSKKEQAQRLTAMMVIHDMDESIETLKKIREREEYDHNVTKYVIDNLDKLESLSDDTLNIAMRYLCEGTSLSSDLEFNESSEKMFHSSQEAWSTLNDVSFIRNIEDFYKDRATFKQLLSFYAWQKPVSKSETDSMATNTDVFSSLDTFTDFLKHILGSKRCDNYMENYENRLSFYDDLLKDWANRNNENKFLMNISDEELAEFVERTSRESHYAKEKDIIGTWIDSAVDAHITELEFHSNHTFLHFQSYKLLNQDLNFSGKGYLEVTVSGEWKINGDSLVLTYNLSSLKTGINEKDIVYRKETRDSVRRSLQSYKDQQLSLARKKIEAAGIRRTKATNIDTTGKSLELTDSNNKTTHYKRKK